MVDVKLLVMLLRLRFLFSLTIELLQVFLKVGTFQVADLVYNTTGGLLGAVIYWIQRRHKRETII